MAKRKVAPTPEGVTEAMVVIEKTLGKGVVFRPSDGQDRSVSILPTGIACLDEALGAGGLPWGRVIEIMGPESGGKTTLALHFAAAAQKADPRYIAFVDAEHALDLDYAAKIGVDMDRALISQPDCGEDALEAVDILARSGGVSMIIVDSVAALTPRAELEGQMGDSHVGLQARMMGQALRKLTALVHANGVLVVFINQLRMKIGVRFGSPVTTTGGNALKFYASVRLDVRRISSDEVGGVAVSNRTLVKITKNKIAPPFRKCEFDIVFGLGVDTTGDALDTAVVAGTVVKRGSWYWFKGERLANGRQAMLTLLREDDELAQSVKDATASEDGK